MHDLIIVGGGPVGTTLAAALDGSGVSVLLLEARPAGAREDRPLALSHGSRLILERIGVWEELSSATPIDSIHVSQRGGFGRTVMHAQEVGVPALGYVTAYSALQAALDRRLVRGSTKRLLGAHVTDLTAEAQRAIVGVERDGGIDALGCQLAVIADGGAAARNASLQETRDYHQSAVVTEVETDLPHRGRAFERFAPAGPMALLPCSSRYALIWTVPPEEANRLCEVPLRVFLEHLQEQFGDRAGRFLSASPRAVYPLTMRRAHTTNEPRVVLVGNASQTLHPVAGQGLNLGLRDAFELAETILADPGRLSGADVATRFHRQRRRDRASTIFLTDTLVRGFSNNVAGLRLLRGCGLTLLDIFPPAKQAFMQRMMFGA